MNKELFLISSSHYSNGDYLAHCADALKNFLGPMNKDEIIAFVPYASHYWDAYTLKVKKYFAAMGYRIESVHKRSQSGSLLDEKRVKAVFVGGGNTFLLREQFDLFKIFAKIFVDVKTGLIKYIGSGAGAIMACPTIKTTNDMPIVLPSSFESLGLINFQINPHFVPCSLIPRHMGETRETRIEEYHEHNTFPVVGLPEDCWITVKDDKSILCGASKAVIFRRNGNNTVWLPGEPFDEDGML